MTVYVKNGGIIISYKKNSYMDILYVGTVQATQIPSFPRTSAVQIATRLRQVSHVNRRSSQHRRGLDEQLLEKKSIDYLSRLKLYNT